MIVTASLFGSRELRQLLEEKREGLRREIDRAPDDSVLTVDAREWADALAARYALEVPTLELAGWSMDEAEGIQVDVSHEGFTRALGPGPGPHYVRGTRHVVHVPFAGDPEIFFLQPSTVLNLRPTARISGDEVLIAVEYPNDAPLDIAAQAKGVASLIEEWLQFARNDAATHRQSLHHEALMRIEARRTEVQARRERVGSSGIPVRASSDRRPTLVEHVRRRPSPLPTSAPASAPIPLDPSLPDEVFSDVLRAIAQAGRDMERSPDAYAGMDEEARRQVLLLALNGQYQGVTTAEAFNVAGKTDLRILYEGQSLFIGECKIWRGPKSFRDTLDQLLGYGGWRDQKLAAVIFVRQRGLTEIVGKAKAAIAGHPQFVAERPGEDETELRAQMHWEGDPARLLDLAVRFIHTLDPAAPADDDEES